MDMMRWMTVLRMILCQCGLVFGVDASISSSDLHVFFLFTLLQQHFIFYFFRGDDEKGLFLSSVDILVMR